MPANFLPFEIVGYLGNPPGLLVIETDTGAQSLAKFVVCLACNSDDSHIENYQAAYGCDGVTEVPGLIHVRVAYRKASNLTTGILNRNDQSPTRQPDETAQQYRQREK